jgi:hypothetical protein
MFEHGAAMDRVEAAEIGETPLGEVPPSLFGERAGFDATFGRDDRAERTRVVGADAVEVDPEDEAAIPTAQNDTPRKSSAASMKWKSFGVAK